MAEQLETLIKCLEFTEVQRADIIFTGDVRLDPKVNKVQLKVDQFGDYPTTGDHYVISELFQPAAVREWSHFQAFISHEKDGLTSITGEGFRLHDGTDQFWWNGSAWAVNTTNWNTENEVAANISAFPTTAKKIRVAVRLTSSDNTKTPSLEMVKIGWKAKVKYLEDIIYRTLVPYFRGLRPVTDYAFRVQFPGGSTLELGTAVDASGIPFNLIGVDSVFDHTSDPGHLTDLVSSYNPGTRQVTLSSSIPVGDYAFCQVIVEPEVSVHMASQDFLEVEKVPAIIIQDIRSVNSSALSQDDHVVNKSDGSAIRVVAPYRFDLEFSILALAPGAVDLLRMIENIVDLLENTPLITSAALDRKYRLWMVDEFQIITDPNKSGSHSARSTFIIKDVLAWKRPAIAEQSIQNVKFRDFQEGDGDHAANADIPFSP